MNLNSQNAFTIRLVPQRGSGELQVAMTAVPDGTKSVFASPAESWDDCYHQLREIVGISADLLNDAAGRLRSGIATKLIATCFVTEILQAGFTLMQK